MDNLISSSYEDIYSEIKETLLQSRNHAYNAVNFAIVQAYWQIGHIIVEHEQNGSLRAEYGKAVLQEISEKLQQEFGGGFSVRNLQQMKKFYVLFPNTNALRSQLTWTLFSTHEDTIMDQELFQRDEIWFVERNADNASRIYSLDRFKERYDKKRSKVYLKGRYGAIPVFRQFTFWKAG